MTVDDLWGLPDDGTRYELIEGVLFEMAPTGGDHSEIDVRLISRMFIFVDEHDLGTVYESSAGFVLSRVPATVLSPDAAFVRKARKPKSTVGFVDVAPDLAVEIVSLSNSRQEIARKIEQFFNAGTQLIWIVEPRLRSVTVWTSSQTWHELIKEDYLNGGDVLPGFRLRVANIFPRIEE